MALVSVLPFLITIATCSHIPGKNFQARQYQGRVVNA